MTMLDNLCDCCHQNPLVGVASSSLGPMSFAWCKECLAKPAEPEFMFEFVAWAQSRPAEYMETLFTYRDGDYISWKDWYEKYAENAIQRLNATPPEII